MNIFSGGGDRTINGKVANLFKRKKTAVNVTIKSNELLQRCKCRQHVYDVQNHFYCKIYRTDREKDWKGDCDRVDGDRVDSVCTSEIRVLHGDLVSPHKD